MVAKSLSLALATFFLPITTSIIAAEQNAESPAQQIDAGASQSKEQAPEVRYQHAKKEYVVRLSEFKDGRSPAIVVVRSNKRLLQASLVAGIPNAAIDYDQRAATIESYAKRNLELRTGTRQEVTLAESARLDAILKHILGGSPFGDN